MTGKRQDHRGEQQPKDLHHQPPPEHEPGSSDVLAEHRSTSIEHVFVLMLENRSFDHMLGFSRITGTDAATGKPTAIDGLKGTESNTHAGRTYTVSAGAPDVAPHPPGHSFTDVLEQLCGAGAVYAKGGAYPKITNSGYVPSYARQAGTDSPGDIMKCYSPSQLPVLNALAREFVVCDRWFSSMPGPTWPNRMFAHAASAAGFDEAPSVTQEAEWATFLSSGIHFEGGNLFERLGKAGVKYRIYADDSFPNVSELENISIVRDVREFDDMAEDLRVSGFDAGYVFIEPSYDVFGDFKDSNSQHPLGSAAAGEALIKETYEAIRNSPVWEHSLLIITWDEHGGFYDHAIPGPAVKVGPEGRTCGFTFEQLGPRVPAVIVSPLIPRNQIEHRPLEHTAIPSTVERVFGLPALNRRDAWGNGVNHLAVLKTARADAPTTLPAVGKARVSLARAELGAKPATRPNDLVAADPEGNAPAMVRLALHQHLQVSPPAEHVAILARARAIQTRGQALDYVREVRQRIHTKRLQMRATVPA